MCSWNKINCKVSERRELVSKASNNKDSDYKYTIEKTVSEIEGDIKKAIYEIIHYDPSDMWCHRMGKSEGTDKDSDMDDSRCR